MDGWDKDGGGKRMEGGEFCLLKAVRTCGAEIK